jgi:hypothetical protein
VFPVAGDADQETITIIGKKDSVDKAVKELEERIAALVSLPWRLLPLLHGSMALH